MPIHTHKVAAIALLLLTTWGHGAISFDTASSSSSLSSTTSSWLHTCSGDDLLLHVSCNASGTSTTGVTYNGVAMTRSTYTAYGTDSEVSNWYLANPAGGANTVLATFAVAPIGTICGGVSLNGVHQATPLDGVASATGAGSPTSVSITTSGDNAWIVDFVGDDTGTTTFSETGSQVRRWRVGLGFADAASSTLGPISPPAITALSWNESLPAAWGHIATSYLPCVSCAGTRYYDPTLLLTGGE